MYNEPLDKLWDKALHLNPIDEYYEHYMQSHNGAGDGYVAPKMADGITAQSNVQGDGGQMFPRTTDGHGIRTNEDDSLELSIGNFTSNYVELRKRNDQDDNHSEVDVNDTYGNSSDSDMDTHNAKIRSKRREQGRRSKNEEDKHTSKIDFTSWRNTLWKGTQIFNSKESGTKKNYLDESTHNNPQGRGQNDKNTETETETLNALRKKSHLTSFDDTRTDMVAHSHLQDQGNPHAHGHKHDQQTKNIPSALINNHAWVNDVTAPRQNELPKTDLLHSPTIPSMSENIFHPRPVEDDVEEYELFTQESQAERE
ncbi:hypothetical protein RFI_12979 [Reticulomyxa filosa]|uniref:Uncharacterized protein n=1 Tax=Reticulomyxa filosa TaxID=46433 RepID=X6NEJ0_RETFI|nr:hypothetical protein RFI_12979 [Reticulomyxa filosa]|eukprot:ETO24179.1 hypothetical protein RFI_12979 [Reticulomyxa filosa]